MDYRGRPFQDSAYQEGPQLIPGRIRCAYYDLGGEEVAYHDSDSVNHGSGELNPADGSYLNEFRMHEGVDISYVKDGGVDNNPFNFVEPEPGQLYIGWTEPGEWVKYTVDVKQTGHYSVSLLYTSNRGGEISISVNDCDVTGPIHIQTTYRPDDPIQWRQWHHWNRVKDIARIQMEKGIQVLTLHTLKNGNMNYASLDFDLIDER